MKTSRKRIPSGLSFAAGTLAGAVAVFIPLTSAGIGLKVEGPGRPLPRAVQPASATVRHAVDADATSSLKKGPEESDAPSNETTCDQQLD